MKDEDDGCERCDTEEGVSVHIGHRAVTAIATAIFSFMLALATLMIEQC